MTIIILELKSRFENETTLLSLKNKGMQFSFSTARLGPSAIKITNQIMINLPVVFMQGALIYNIKDKICLDVQSIDRTSLGRIILILKRHGMQCFIFGVQKNKLVVFYESINSSHLQAFYDLWISFNNISFIKVDNLCKILDYNIIYLLTTEFVNLIKPAYEDIIKLPDICTAFYDSSNGNEIYNLECLKRGVTKYKSVLYLKKLFGFSKVVGFGDTINDVPLLEACDEFYVPSNADNRLKNLATGTIHSNDEDGVAKFLVQHFTSG